jgi:transposase
VIAVAHAILEIAYHIIARREPYREVGEDYLHRLDPEARAKRLVHQLGHLGFDVILRPAGAPSAPVG